MKMGIADDASSGAGGVRDVQAYPEGIDGLGSITLDIIRQLAVDFFQVWVRSRLVLSQGFDK